MRLKTKLMTPVIVLFVLTILTLAYLTEIRESSHHLDRELEAWVDVGQSLVSAWSTTMLLTGSDNLARDQLYQQDNKNILSISIVRNPKLKRINPQSSLNASTDREMEIIENGIPISEIFQSGKSRRLLTLVPVIAKPQCINCHNRQNQHDINIGDVMAVVTLETSLEIVDIQISSDKNSVLYSLTAALLLGVVFIFYSIQRIIRPIRDLTDLSQKVRSGDLNVTVTSVSNDELGVLTRSFNEMTTQLYNSRTELQDYAKRLESEKDAKAEEIRQSEATFSRLTAKTANTTGMEFFESLVLNISEWLGCRWGLLGEVVGGEDVNVLVRCGDGKLLEPIQFSLRDSPFEDLSDSRFKYYDNVRELFPHDDLLREMNADAYFGISFFSSTSEPMGIMIAFHDGHLKPPSNVAEVFKVFAERVAAELERQRIEEERNSLVTKLKEAERERSQRILRAGETRYRNLVETTSDWIWEVDKNNIYTYASPKVFELLGYHPEEVIGKQPFDFMPSEEADRVREIFNKLLESEDSIERLVNINIHKDGSQVILETSGVPIFDDNGNHLGYRGVDRNITKRRKMEMELLHSHSQLRELSLHQQNLLEQERGRIARELHDELGMALTAVKMDISWLKDNLTHGKSQALFVDIASKLDSTIDSMRRIATELRPGILDTMGIGAAIEWLLETFEKQTGIPCDLDLPNEDLLLDGDQSTAVFRIIQESLTNVIRHAEASRLKVSIAQSSSKVELKIIDDGKGITEKQLTSHHSLGILGMRERILPWGGKINIESNGIIKGGTTINVMMPLKGGKNK